MAVAGACVLAGMLLTWSIQQALRPDDAATPERQPAAAAPAAAPERSVLWLLAVGVSRYRDASTDLRYAASDARAVADALARQRGAGLYAEAHTLVLSDEAATRESILRGMQDFLGRAGPEDVVVVFLAGHGVQERSTGTFYFLPHPANSENVLTAGLRMSDFDEMIRIVRRRVRALVIMLDTCHAGALRVDGGHFVPTAELAAGLSTGDGFYLLAASSAGEQSREDPALGHGVFTAALLDGLGGAGDADADGVLTISELFGHVARGVARASANQQHPYSKMEGIDLRFATVRRDIRVAALPTLDARAVAAAQAVGAAALNSVGVMEFRDLRKDPAHDWIGRALRIAFNTELSKVRALRVYSPEIIDRTAQELGADDLTTAQRLHIEKLFTGAFHILDDTIRIDAKIIDAASGVQEGSDSVQGNLDDFLRLQKQLVLSMLRRLPVQISRTEGESIEQQTNTDVDAYRLLLQAEGMVDERAGDGSVEAEAGNTIGPPAAAPETVSPAPLSWLLLASPAMAEEVTAPPSPDPATMAEIAATIEAYRTALERKDLDALARLYVTFTPRQRAAQQVYLDNADHLRVEFTDLRIEAHGTRYSASFLRTDRFVDHKTGRTPPPLEVRLTKFFTRHEGRWRMEK